MLKCVFSALVLSMVLPSIAAAQSAQSVNADPIRLAFVSPQRAFLDITPDGIGIVNQP